MSDDTAQVPSSKPSVAGAILLLAVIFAVGLGLDLWVKAAAWDHFVADVRDTENGIQLIRQTGANDIVVASKVLELTAVANEGAAMGLGQGRQTLFVSVSVVAVLVLLGFFWYSLRASIGGRFRRGIYHFVLAMLLAGVVGNFYDRVTHGYVRDMFHIFPGVTWSSFVSGWSDSGIFPWVFNLADVYLCVGVAAVFLFGLLMPDDEKPEATTGEEAPA